MIDLSAPSSAAALLLQAEAGAAADVSKKNAADSAAELEAAKAEIEGLKSAVAELK